MATIKSYTDIPQSKTLSKILPLESADMHWSKDFDGSWFADLSEYKSVKIPKYVGNVEKHLLPCWSLTALLGVLPDGTDIIKDKADTENEKYMCTVGVKDDIISTFSNNPIDACVEMIEKLDESKLL